MMKKAKRKSKARRKSGAKPGHTVASAIKKIASMFQIPRQAVWIIHPNRRRVSPATRLANVRKVWD
jgi:hypothetical protein